MKIVITSNYRPDSETGSNIVTKELAEYLSKINNVLFICAGEKYKLSKVSKSLKIINIPSINIDKLTVPIITPRVLYKVFKYLEKFKPDIIHAQNPMSISSMCQLWAQINHIPFVVTFHHIPTQAIEQIVPKMSKNIFTQVVQEIYKRTTLKSFLNKTDGVIALNKSVKRSVRKIDKKIKIEVINNGLDTTKLKSLKIEKNLKPKINFLFLGSYIQRKNQEYLIKVFSKLPPNYILFTYGNIETGHGYYLKLLKLKRVLKAKNVNLRDFIDGQDLINTFSKSHFFISASLKEAQSLAVIQALAAGKPVIGLENETTLELIGNTNGLVMPKKTTPKRFAENLIEFVKKTDYLKLAKNARNSSEKFDIEKVVLKVNKFYQSLADTHSHKTRGNISQNYNKILKSIIFQK